MRHLSPVRRPGMAGTVRPRLLFAGVPVDHGPMAVISRHLAGLDVWEIARAESTQSALELIPEFRPNVLVTVCHSEAELQAWVVEVRRQEEGRHVPIIVAGGPAGPDGGPLQPVRRVLCLPSPLKWRTFLLCLDEHWRALQRKSA
jgi:hypothetical protein